MTAGGASPEVVVHAGPDVLAAAAAARLLTALVDAQTARGRAGVVLTGGGIGTAVLTAVRASPACGAVDWRAVDVWWGDERFVARDSPDRNARGAWEALLAAVGPDPARVHEMGAAQDYPSPEAAADAYAAVLADAGVDVLLLGMGPEGHVGSIFPGSAAVRATGSVVAVRDCPKPPPQRVTLTLPAMCRAREVWLLVSGSPKAAAVRRALSGACAGDVPAAGVRGTDRTLWLVDREAAEQLPAGLGRYADPS